MKWIPIKEEKPKSGDKVIIWANNLSDPECSRHYSAVYYEYTDDPNKPNYGESFLDVYPRSWDMLFKSVKDFTSRDLEGDTIQMTHWMPLPPDPNNI